MASVNRDNYNNSNNQSHKSREQNYTNKHRGKAKNIHHDARRLTHFPLGESVASVRWIPYPIWCSCRDSFRSESYRALFHRFPWQWHIVHTYRRAHIHTYIYTYLHSESEPSMTSLALRSRHGGHGQQPHNLEKFKRAHLSAANSTMMPPLCQCYYTPDLDAATVGAHIQSLQSIRSTRSVQSTQIVDDPLVMWR